ncbi:uncharacterized protein LOC134836307 [Culicoides brevitarsis]|uniref:uncharacterized protein LOC134836307 n=1 Tax=Culicoides brevitarsis TaxID=469753 RepID=UPI00307C3F73
MDTKEINLDYFKHQSIHLLAIIKQLSSIEDQYEAIIYILSAINAYLKNIFTYNDREILKTKIYSNPELVKGHVNDVLKAIKGDDEKVEQAKLDSIVPKVKNLKSLLHFPYYIRSTSSQISRPKATTTTCKVLYKITNRFLATKNLEDYSYKEIIRWTAGINRVNKLKSNLKVRVLVRKTVIPRGIKRSVSLSAADDSVKLRKITASKVTARSQSTNVRHESPPNPEFVDSIDYDELILNPELEKKLVRQPIAVNHKEASKSPKARRLSKDSNTGKVNNSVNSVVMGDLDDEKLEEMESEEDDEEPKASVSDPNAKKPAKKRKTYPCIFCKKSYRSRKSLMLHFQHHPGLCPDCGVQIGFSPAEIVEHNRQFHIKERPIICEECGESFTRNQQYQVHLQCHQKAKDKEDVAVPKHVCSECGAIFVNQKGLEKHIMETEHKQDKRLCEICGVDFDTNTRLLQHVRRVHRPKSFSCTHCSKQFTLKCNLDRHIKSLHSNNPSKLVCEHCGNEYTNQNTLNEHMEMAHKKSKIWKCNVCDKTFFIKRLLKVHEIVHSEYRPFQCTQCDQCYKRRSHLDRHIHFSHNKNGKVTRDSTQTLQNGEKVPKKKKTPEEIALKKALKAEAASHAAAGVPAPIPNSNPQATYHNATNAMHPTFDYNMQPYGNAQTAAGASPMDYNAMPQHHVQQTPVPPPQQQQQDPNAMYYNDQMIKYENTQPYPSQQQQQPGTNYHHQQQTDFTNQYYMQQPQAPQQPDMTGSWNNMQMYNNGSAPSADAMNYYGHNAAEHHPQQQQPQSHHHPEQKHQQPNHLMNIPNTDLFYGQENMWNHQPDPSQNQNHPHHHPHPQVGNTYNNIGNILTNLELIGNNSNFENNFDIVTSQGMGHPPGVPTDDPTQQTQQQQQMQQSGMTDYQMFDYAPGFMKAPFE